jgi:hypothetical protein
MNDPWKEQAKRNATLNPWTDSDTARLDAKRAAEESPREFSWGNQRPLAFTLTLATLRHCFRFEASFKPCA